MALKERRSADALQDAKAVVVLLPGLVRSIMFCGMCVAPLGLLERGLFLLAQTLWLQGSNGAARDALDQAVKATPALQAKRQIMEYMVTPEDFL